MTEVRDNSDAEWEEKIVKEVEERRAKRSKTRSQDLDRILLLKRRQLDEDVNLACAGHQARYDSDVREHLQKLKLQAYKAKESTPDLKARIDQETTLLHQQVPRAQEMMDLMDHLRAQVGLPKPEFEAPQSHDLLGLQEAEQARDAEQWRWPGPRRPRPRRGLVPPRPPGQLPTLHSPPIRTVVQLQCWPCLRNQSSPRQRARPTTWQDPGMASAVDPVHRPANPP